MQLESLILKNFRSYEGEYRIPIKDLTVFIGQNDAGKSTVLEALEIFFNNDQVKFEGSDYHRNHREGEVRIGCEFSDFPKEMILDAQATTCLEQEFLLNKNGLVEIHKLFSGGSIKPKSLLIANYPIVDEFGQEPLIELSNSKLKALVKKVLNGDQVENLNLSSNPSMRIALLNKSKIENFKTIEIPGDKGTGKPFIECINQHLPLYSLFRSDKKNDDKDGEVQEPIKFAVKSALGSVEIQKTLEKIKKDVLDVVNDVTARTATKLKEMDEEIAKALKPDLTEEPKWDKVFSYKIEDETGVPLNKRGSGVRRLVLLNFFRAEADRKLERDENRTSVIYAIEEPETSQHPDNQKLLADAMIELSNADNTQVLLTTHVPAMAELLPVDRFCLIHKSGVANQRLEFSDSEKASEILDSISKALGVTPNPILPKVLITVEGANDINCLVKFSKLLNEKDSEQYIDLSANESRAVVLPAGGSSLRHWVSKQYLSSFKLPELYIFDRDEDKKYEEQVEQVNKREDESWATLTEGLTMENYLHPRVVSECFQMEIDFAMEDNVPLKVAKNLYEQNGNKKWVDLSEKTQAKKLKRVKIRLNEEVAGKMTFNDLLERDQEGKLQELLNRAKKLTSPL